MEEEKDFADDWQLVTDAFEEDLWWDDWTILWSFMQNPDNGDFQYGYSEWTSKKFWFIQWLVDNRDDLLVDYDAVFDPDNWRRILIWGYSIPTINWMLFDSLVSALAVSDEPIEFLCKILK